MATTKVSILDPTGSKKTTVELPDNVSVERLLESLVPKLGLPPNDQAGQPISYRLSGTRDGQEQAINPDQTLSQAGIEDDDALRLYANMQGGTRR